jgi:hypothetical protein
MPWSFGRPPELPKAGEDTWPFLRWLASIADRFTNHAKTVFRLDDYRNQNEEGYSAAFLRAANENPTATTHYGIPLQIPAGRFDLHERISIPAGTFQSKLHCIEGIGGGGSDIKPTLVFHDTSGDPQLDFSQVTVYPTLRNFQMYHADGIPTDTTHGTGVLFGQASPQKTASHARLQDLWVANFDIGIEWADYSFYGMSIGVNTFYNYSAGVKYSGSYMNGFLTIGGSASQTQAGSGDYATNVGSSMGFIGRYREANDGNGMNAVNFHVIYDIGAYSEGNGGADYDFPNIYAFNASKYLRMGCYHDGVQTAGLPRVRGTKTKFTDIASHYVNDTAVPPFKWDESIPYGTWPSVFINDDYRTAKVVNDEAGHVIIDQKHPLVLFSDGAPAQLPVQRGTYFHNKSSTTVSRIRGYAVTVPGWVAGVPATGHTCNTTAASKEINNLGSSVTNIFAGDWITVTGETFGGSASVMVNYVEPGIKLFVETAADTGVTGAALAFATATVKTDYYPVRGTFTCANAATTTVSDQAAAVLTTSVITLMPTNAAAANLMNGAKSLYVSARTAATSFVVSTADASAAAGTETFEYIIHNT